jgi:NhaP-type Na+/H+ or K+/H+ antiporter
LDVISLKKIKFQILKFSFLPNIAEAFMFAIIGHFILKIPLLWSTLTGFVVCGVSPAVVVPVKISFFNLD